MTIEELTIELLAERTFSQFDSKKLVNWAVNILGLNYQNEHLFILAGLDFDTTEEREKYFWKSINELNINIELNEAQLIEVYALSIANKAINNTVSIDYAFNQMLKIVSTTGYDNKYISFYEIAEDLDCLRYNNSTIFNETLSLENYKVFLLEEFKIFVEMETLKIPKTEREKCYCQKCNRLNTPITKNKYQFKKPYKYLVYCCCFCSSEKILFNNNHIVKNIIINNYKKL